VGKNLEGVKLIPDGPGIQMPNGRDVFIHATQYMSRLSQSILTRNGKALSDLSWLIPHQANFRISRKVAADLGLPLGKVVSNIQYLGNTGCAGCGIALSEHRSSGAAPFRCPKPVYDLIAEVINDAPESFRFNDVYEEVKTRLGEEVPDYQVRVTIRFLIHTGAIKHYKAKFINEQKRSFRRIAKEAWDDLQRRTEAGQVPG